MTFARAMSFASFILVLAISHSGVSAKPAKKELIEDVFNKYKNSKFVKLDVKKTVKSDVLGKSQVFEGEIYLSKKLFRWDTETPEKTQLIFDGTTVWNIQYPPKEFKGEPNVGKMKLDSNSKKQILISTLLNQEALTKNFKILKQTQDGAETLVNLEPKTPDPSMKNLNVKFDRKAKKITLISYEDDLGNLINIEILKTTFPDSLDSKLFKYQPSKGASVTNL